MLCDFPNRRALSSVSAYNFIMKIRLSQNEMREYVVARGLLAKTGFGLVEAAKLANAVAERLGSGAAGTESPETLIRSLPERCGEGALTFGEVFGLYLKSRRNLRPRTRSDYRQRCRQLLERAPALKEAPLTRLSTNDCLSALNAAFPRDRQAVKGRALMSAVFAFAQRLGIIPRNPVAAIGVPEVAEKEIVALTPREGEALVSAARRLAGTRAALAVGLMLYGGIRPTEVSRLRRADVDLREGVICIAPTRSKTGGARHVSVFPPLMRLLREPGALPPEEDARLVPADWTRKWLRIRRACGWGSDAARPWRQDVLRHTFASYHLKLFRDIAKLQLEMGHTSPKLLFTRYVNLRGVALSDAKAFFR